MKKLIYPMLALLAVGCGKTGSDGAYETPAIPVDTDLESKVKEIVGKMSLEDKI